MEETIVRREKWLYQKKIFGNVWKFLTLADIEIEIDVSLF